MLKLGIDAGGTFTDFVLQDDKGIKTVKVLSTPQDPSRAIIEGLSRLFTKLPESLEIIHGSTVADGRMQDWVAGLAVNPTLESGDDLSLFFNASETVVDEAFEYTLDGPPEYLTFQNNIIDFIRLMQPRQRSI